MIVTTLPLRGALSAVLSTFRLKASNPLELKGFNAGPRLPRPGYVSAGPEIVAD